MCERALSEHMIGLLHHSSCNDNKVLLCVHSCRQNTTLREYNKTEPIVVQLFPNSRPPRLIWEIINKQLSDFSSL